MSTAAGLLDEGAAKLAGAGVERPRAEARLLLEAATGENRARLLAHSDRPVAESDAERYRGWIARRADREPAAYILGYAEFWSLRFRVGPGVLVPRADSETMIQGVLKTFPDRERPLRVLDLGIGSGCLLLTVLHLYVNARGLGLDASENALAYARANAEALGVDARLELRRADWRDGLAGTFDIILANPPYIPSAEIDRLEPEVARHEPREALDGGADGLDAYRTIVPVIFDLLDEDGSAFLEVGAGQWPEVFAFSGLKSGGWGMYYDLSGTVRCLKIWPR
jgi:release factor glutamine methyltransferase